MLSRPPFLVGDFKGNSAVSILGVDFLRHFSLDMDPTADCLLDLHILTALGTVSSLDSAASDVHYLHPPTALSSTLAGPNVKMSTRSPGPASQVATSCISNHNSSSVVTPSKKACSRLLGAQLQSVTCGQYPLLLLSALYWESMIRPLLVFVFHEWPLYYSSSQQWSITRACMLRVP